MAIEFGKIYQLDSFDQGLLNFTFAVTNLSGLKMKDSSNII